MLLFEIVNDFVIGYPIFVSIVWIVGCLLSELYRKNEIPTSNNEKPLVSILVPAHNEHDTLRSAIASVAEINYHPFEVVMIDDKSNDDTLKIMDELKKKYEGRFKVTIVPIQVNQGKANALNQGLKHANGKYIVGIDSDSILDQDSVTNMVKTLNRNSKIGAVAGKPVVKNRTTILGRLQLLEYIGVIDIIKKAESFLVGRVNTISGVIVGFRKEALKDVNGWNPNVMTEDIDITWRLYRNNWLIKYRPEVICWILVPENIKSLIKQRRRWARGGMEVLVNNYDLFIHGKTSHRFLLLETVTSNAWAILTALSTISYITSFIGAHELQLDGDVLLILLIISFSQFVIGFFASKTKAYLHWRDLLLVPAYVIYYWVINLISCIAALISFVLDPQNKGTWSSPDRGL